MVERAAHGWPAVAPGSWLIVRQQFLDGLSGLVAWADAAGSLETPLAPAIQFPPLAQYSTARRAGARRQPQRAPSRPGDSAAATARRVAAAGRQLDLVEPPRAAVQSGPQSAGSPTPSSPASDVPTATELVRSIWVEDRRNGAGRDGFDPAGSIGSSADLGRRSRGPDAAMIEVQMANILQSLPVGEQRRHRLLRRSRHQRRAALDARQGRDSLRLHRESGPAGRTRLRRHSAPREAVRRREGTADRLPGRAGQRRSVGAAVRRLPHLDRRRGLLQHHADRPRGHRHAARRRDEGRRRARLGRWQHVQGQRHRAVLSLRPARQPQAADLQALARSDLHRRAGRPRGDVGIHAPGRPRLQDERREGLFDRLEHPRRHPRSQGSRAAQLERAHRRADHGRAVLEAGRRDQAGGSDDPLRRGACRSRSTGSPTRTRRPDRRGQPDRRTSRPRHERSDREPHHRGQEPRHLRGARAWRCCSSATNG